MSMLYKKLREQVTDKILNAQVNRLTRELSALRQQSASVASTSSSTSNGPNDFIDFKTSHMHLGSSHPTPSRKHRSSSNLSSRSVNNPTSTANTSVSISDSAVSGIAPARDATAAGSLLSHARESLSRHNSVASSRRSEAPSPSLSASLPHGDQFQWTLPHRPSVSQQSQVLNPHLPQQAVSHANARSPTRATSIVSPRYEEAAHHRAELESVKRENETLKRRIRELERGLSGRRQSSIGRANGKAVIANSANISQASGHGGMNGERSGNVGNASNKGTLHGP